MNDPRTEAARSGLYRPETERDACGVGLIANVDGTATHETVKLALSVLERLTHRGAAGTDPETGDGAGVLLQIPHALFHHELATHGIALPPAGTYGVGMLFLPSEDGPRRALEGLVDRAAHDEGFRVLAWRDVPTAPTHLGPLAKRTLPAIRQVFLTSNDGALEGDALERSLYLVRRRVEREARSLPEDFGGIYVNTLSSRTICYKGLLVPEKIARFYVDLANPLAATAIAVVHQRFSTNTFPSWARAHPYRLVAHNGEINALRGNVNWMRAREARIASPLYGEKIDLLRPVVDETGSDSSQFDNVLELLLRSGRELPHAMSMMMPEAWERDDSIPDAVRAYYAFHGAFMEPWDGPAAMCFTDGRVAGAILDRNGLRPLRYTLTTDGLLVVASEAGVVDIPPDRVLLKNRIQPGKMLIVDTHARRVIGDDEVKAALAARRPYATWLAEHVIPLEKLPDCGPMNPPLMGGDLVRSQRVHGYSSEDLRMILAPMGSTGYEAVGSMGNDAPLAVLSDRPQLLFHYFKQLFAQVTNPPIDPLREELAMSLRTPLGARRNLLAETPEHCRRIVLAHPVISSREMARILACDAPGLFAATLPALFHVRGGGPALRGALDDLCDRAARAVRRGHGVLVISDRGHDAEWAPIPSLLAAAAVHHHLMREGLLLHCSLVVECGDAREVMHFCLLVGYGVGAIHPYVACDSVAEMARENGAIPDAAVDMYLEAANKGILKVMSKMGISSLSSYRGAQIFEAIGISKDVIDRYFTGTPARLDGVGLDAIASEAGGFHREGYTPESEQTALLRTGGAYQWRRDGEPHAYDPDSVGMLQHAVRSANYGLFKKYSNVVNAVDRKHHTIRGLLRFKPGTPVPIDEVEPASEIVKRFKTGAMSFGSISREAHETLAIAMNRIGGRSNSGEGGEDATRYVPDVTTGDLRRSAIKQVASGRFGVTSHYLVNADELQIKMAQGAKPGEGGQLPGHKVDETIARIRHSTAGVGLISPPPHHDIYSIEDLAQLIHDLRNANDRARVSVKLVAEVGVGTVAAGVAKANADVILISGDSGGTGAAPLTSLKHAGAPWELGLAETQQVLVLNGLRSRVRLETDGQLKTGRDVAIAALLGAEEYGFATAALVASGCVMMRVCHLNTCPVGIATQDPVLRRRFPGQPEHVINFMVFVAEELREIMASLGVRSIDEMVGRTDFLEADEVPLRWSTKGIDVSALLHRPAVKDAVLRCTTQQTVDLADEIDARLIVDCAPALENREKVSLTRTIRNVDRTTCTRLSAEVSRRHGAEGLPRGTISLRFEGTAGQSFCAFLASGIEVDLEGEANDYVGKGLSGGRVAIVPPRGAAFVPEENVIVGNVVLYGATSGELFVRGRAGERFAVRNSGAHAVVEGVGDHGCEYMTGGRVVVLGTTGKNFAAGMSGGVAYVLDVDGRFASRCNPGMVDLEELDERNATEVRALIHRHYEHTGSAVAWRVLSGWRELSREIVKVMPKEYRKVLAAHDRDPNSARQISG